MLHGWPALRVLIPEDALVQGDARAVPVEGVLTVGGGSAQLCQARPDRRPPRCPGDAPRVEGVVANGTLEVHDGLWRVDVEGGAISSVTHVRTRLVQAGSPPPSSPPPPGPTTHPDRD